MIGISERIENGQQMMTFISDGTANFVATLRRTLYTEPLYPI